MIDEAKIEKLVKWRAQSEPNWPWLDRDYIGPFMEALGEDEEAIIEFLASADQATLGEISSFTEVLFAKFPSDAMGEAVDKLF